MLHDGVHCIFHNRNSCLQRLIANNIQQLGAHKSIDRFVFLQMAKVDMHGATTSAHNPKRAILSPNGSRKPS